MLGIILVAALLFAAPLVVLFRLAYSKPTPVSDVRAMLPEDQLAIEKYAKGEQGIAVHSRAIHAYRRTPKLQHGDEGLAHYLFMREVDTTAPDLGWRAIQRQRLLDSLN